MAQTNEEPKHYSVLTIDDEYTIRTVHRYMLEELGYRVFDADNGQAGLEVFDEQQPDLVLIDLNMPVLGGLEVLEYIGRHSPDTPTVIVSGSGIMDDAIQAIRLGAWDYLLKPTSPSVLAHTVEKCLERAELIRQNREFRKHLEEQLQKIKEDEEAGRKIQARLLPPNRWEFGPFFIRQEVLPSMFLSGDFVDFFDVNDHKVVFCCADVSGHGVSSALITIFLKSFTVKYRERYDMEGDNMVLNPSAILRELNIELLREEIDKHMTLFYGVLDSKENTLTYANAGHFPYPILETEEGMEEIRSKGLPIGLFDFAEYESIKRKLPDSFRLTVFSDGVLDFVDRELLDEKIEYLKKHTSDDGIDEILLATAAMEELPDDITILSIRKGTYNG